ncbi:MAG: hypothetical protein FJ037_08710 [Chloroflexi bacterium]|nr:hypothetical protein [Chloroflexota bacterium]
MALDFILVLGSLILGSMGAGPSASAEGPVSVSDRVASGGVVFSGYVFTSTAGTLPAYVRALGPTGVACGTADVTSLSDYAGMYRLSVASSQQKRGCPAPGGVVQFALLAGRVDDGVWAGQVATLTDGDTVRSLHLQAAVSVMGNWAGPSGEIGQEAWLRWDGPSVSLAETLAAMPLPTTVVYYLDPVSGVFAEAKPHTDAVLTAGDLIMVRFR